MANLNQFIFNLYWILEEHPGFQNIGVNLGNCPKNTIHASHLIKFKYNSFPDFELNLGSSLRKLDMIFLHQNSVITFEGSYDFKDCEMIIQIFAGNDPLHKIYRYDIKSLRIIKFGYFKDYHEIEIRK